MTAPRIYLDANVFIYAYETRGTRSEHAWRIFEAIERDELIAVTSELTLAEVLVGPIHDGDDELAGQYHNIFSSEGEFSVAAVERRVLVEAAVLRSFARSLKLPDAIHVATARVHDCKFVISDDSRLSIAPGLSIVQLGPNSLDTIREESR
ncbi:MAG: PIN domain-containing protein [Pseudolabrys sp.]